MTKKRMRILIVEDDEPSEYLIKKGFEARSANVEWDLCFARDGQEALDCLFRHGAHSGAVLPDFVLLDWNLPMVSGKDVLRTLKTSNALCAVPVLVFSSSHENHDIQAAYQGHANSYIRKPADLNDLYNIIESIEKFWVHTASLPSHKPYNGATDYVISGR